MRKNFGPNPLCYPQPVFILAAYGEDGTPNCMNAAWGGISDDREVSVCISAGHKTTANILHSKAFTISMATADQMVACDYVGITSGNRHPDKFARAGFHATPSEFVNAPLIDELPMPQGICPSQGSNPGLPYCRRIIYSLSHQGSPGILEWVAYPFSRGSSRPRNRAEVSW